MRRRRIITITTMDGEDVPTTMKKDKKIHWVSLGGEYLVVTDDMENSTIKRIRVRDDFDAMVCRVTAYGPVTFAWKPQSKKKGGSLHFPRSCRNIFELADSFSGMIYYKYH